MTRPMDTAGTSGGVDYPATSDPYLDDPYASDPAGHTSTGDTSPGDTPTSDVAKDEAHNVGQTATQAGSEVAGTAADQAKQVTQETKRQAQDLLAQGRSQASEQARNGQQQAASSLSALAGELRGMVEHEESSDGGPAHDLVRQATERVDGLADWLQSHEPGEVLAELRRFARRRPGAFLLGAAVAGVVAGRLTTGVVAAHKDQSSADPAPSTAPAVPAPAHSHDQFADPYTAPVTPAYADPAPTSYATPVGDAVPPLPYGSPPPGTESNWADPQRDRDGMPDGGRP